MLTVINLLYSIIAVIAIFGYMPQILVLWKTKTSCKDISLLTWFIWAATWVISLLYGIFELEDLKFCLVAVINLIGHVIVIGLTLKKSVRLSGRSRRFD